MLRRANRCYNGGKQHKFRPRYTEKPLIDPSIAKSLRFNDRRMAIMNVYVGDVCQWCGETTNKQEV